MATEHTYQARLTPPAGTGHPDGDSESTLWEIDVLGVGVTQATHLEEAPAMATSLVSILNPELDPSSIRIEFIR